MSETITVDAAIKRGQFIINAPVFAILFVPAIICYYLSKKHFFPEWSIGVAMGTDFILAWLYWSIMITKWRLWAFENVNNITELKIRAINEKLIWPDGSIFEKTEIRTRADKERLKLIQQRFDQTNIRS